MTTWIEVEELNLENQDEETLIHNNWGVENVIKSKIISAHEIYYQCACYNLEAYPTRAYMQTNRVKCKMNDRVIK